MKEHKLLFLAGIGLQELLLLFIFIIPAVLWLWAIIDLLKRDFVNSTNKLIWAMVVIFFPIIGALLYLIIGRSQSTKP